MGGLKDRSLVVWVGILARLSWIVGSRRSFLLGRILIGRKLGIPLLTGLNLRWSLVVGLLLVEGRSLTDDLLALSWTELIPRYRVLVRYLRLIS